MLHAVIYVDQILDLFQVRAIITEFHAGADPVTWTSAPSSHVLPDDIEQEDALSTTLRLLALWSERTIEG